MKILINKFSSNSNSLRKFFMSHYLRKQFTDFSKEKNILTLGSTQEFNNIIQKSNLPVLVDFYADWCPPCKKLTPVLENKLQENKNFYLLKVNVDDHGDLAETFKVQGIPHVILFKEGKKVQEFVGFNEPSLNKMLDLIKEKNKI